MTFKEYIKRAVPKPVLLWYHLVVASAAALLYGRPSRRLIVIGVTGTKGKSTTATIIAKALEHLGQRVGLTGTIAFKVGAREWLNDKKMTMLGRFATQRLLREMVAAGCRYAVIETSSEGIVQHRHRGIEYDSAVFTNLTPEHIESHGSFEEYRAAKEKLFAHLTRFPRKKINGAEIPKVIIANADDPESARMLAYPADVKITFGTAPGASIRVRDMSLTAAGSRAVINGIPLEFSLLGSFNLMNAAAAVATVTALGFPLDDALRAAATVQAVPGRQEFIDRGQGFSVMVDYAYEPESQKKLYELLTLIPHRRIIHVTGSAGGGRDTARRAVLGKLAGERADIVIVTNEDPYDEDPNAIIEQVAAGALETGKRTGETLFTIADRREAIGRALSLARAGDMVLVTGKGAEQALCVADGKKIPWDDRRVVSELLTTKS